MKKISLTGMMILLLGFTACGEEELKEPDGVTVEYSPDDSGLYVNWEKVKRADEYDVKVEGTTELSDTVTDTSAVIYGVPEGTGSARDHQGLVFEDGHRWFFLMDLFFIVQRYG